MPLPDFIIPGVEQPTLKHLPTQHTQQPIVTGTSVLAVKYNNGVIIAADSLASYGSLARFREECRLFTIHDETLVAGSGDMGDFQYARHLLETQATKDAITNDERQLTPSAVYHYLSQVMYQRRGKNDPLWNSYIVAGVNKGEITLGCVDLHGTTWQGDSLATGFGAYLAQPLLRRVYDAYPGTDQIDSTKDNYKNVTKEQAIDILETCLKVLWCRDARSSKKYYRGIIEADGQRGKATVEGPFEVEAQWSFAETIKGYGRN